MQSRTCSVCLVLLLGAWGTLHAQVYTGTVWGKVTDSTGGVLPGVSIILGSDHLLRPETSVSSSTGSYRFAELPIGTYTVTFELAGFQTFVREGIILTAGSSVQVSTVLALSQIEETVTVSGESPVVDQRETGIPVSFDRDRLENVPTSRDPWEIVQQTPGLLTSRPNVGGNESGQQPGIASRGSSGSQITWNYDGVNLTILAYGSSPTYYHFDAFEEINITSGGHEPSMQTAGAAINFVVKQGTNRYSGQGSFFGTNSALQSSNINDDLRAQGAGAGAPTKYILDYSFDLGGPILRDKLWIWGGYAVQDIHRGKVGFLIPGCDDPDDVDCLHDDPTRLDNVNAKINWQVSPNNKLNFLYMFNKKAKPNRGGSDTRPVETTQRQSGPVHLYKIEDTHIFSSKFLLTGRFAYVDGGWGLDYQDPQQRFVQPSLELSTGTWGRSFVDFLTEPPQIIGNLDGNYFLAEALGGDHEFKFGFQYK